MKTYRYQQEGGKGWYVSLHTSYRSVNLVSVVFALLAIFALFAPNLDADEVLSAQYKTDLVPLLRAACLDCHSGEKPKAGFQMTPYLDYQKVVNRHEDWELIRELITEGDMPPPKAKRQLKAIEKQRIIGWIQSLRSAQAARSAGDPGPRPARRLTNVEYERTVQAITGQSLKVSHTFPIDPTNKAGFSNDASVLTLSPSQIAKYQQAAEWIASHVAFLPSGLRFGPVPMDAPRAHYLLSASRIMKFYKRVHHRTVRLAEHLYAMRRRQEATALGLSDAALQKKEAQEGLAPAFIDLLAATLAKQPWVGHQDIVVMPARIASVDLSDQDKAVKALRRIVRDMEVVTRAMKLPKIGVRQQHHTLENLRTRQRLAASPPRIGSRSADIIAAESHACELALHHGQMTLNLICEQSSALSLEVRDAALTIKRYDTKRKRYDKTLYRIPLRQVLRQTHPELERSMTWSSNGHLRIDHSDVIHIDFKELSKLQIKIADGSLVPVNTKKDTCTVSMTIHRLDSSPVLVQIPGGKRQSEPVQGKVTIHARDLIGGRFLVNDASMAYLKKCAIGIGTLRRILPSYWYHTGDRQEALSMGLYHQTGYFRDDLGLQRYFLTAEERGKLQSLWDDFIVGGGTIETMYRQFISFQRSENSNSPLNKPAGHAFMPEAVDLFTPAVIDAVHQLFKNSRKGKPSAALDAYFTMIKSEERRYRRLMEAAKSKHIEDMLNLAEQAWRRPVVSDSRKSLRSRYQNLLAEYGEHQLAIRTCIVEILTAPQFLFHIEPSPSGTIGPMDAHSLANRLSYVLWSSMPDSTLRSAAHSGDILNAKVLNQHIGRMLADQKVRGFAEGFIGAWLKSNELRSWQNVDRKFYAKAWNDRLQASLAEEPIRFTADILVRHGSFFDLLYAKHVVVDTHLAKHYKLRDKIPAKRWQRIALPKGHQRGGLLGMGGYMTLLAGGQRSSPVKRGHWLVSKVLGEHIPPPPDEVPELPASEQDLGGKSQRQILAEHRKHPDCAACHRRFDDYGVVFERFDPIGRERHKDLAGTPIDSQAVLPNGDAIATMDDLKMHLRKTRHDEFVDHLARQLLVYVLGRSLLVSDDSLLAQVVASLNEHAGACLPVLVTIFTSSQFRMARGHDFQAMRQ